MISKLFEQIMYHIQFCKCLLYMDFDLIKCVPEHENMFMSCVERYIIPLTHHVLLLHCNNELIIF